MKKVLLGLFLSCAGVLAVQGAQASVVISGTRVVYPAKEREVSVRLENAESMPRLVQAWIDRGDPQSRPDTSDAPFLLTPPIVRMEPGKNIALRLMFTHQESLPKDRESLFWLNVMDIPPLPQGGDDSSYLQLAYRSRLKLFYRPDGLPQNATAAAESITWSLLENGKGGFLLRGHNPSPYYVSFNQVSVLSAGQIYSSNGGMLAPQGNGDFPLPGLTVAPGAGAKARYEWIDDYGATHVREVAVGR